MQEKIIERLQQEDGQCTMADLMKRVGASPENMADFEEALFELEQDERITIVENHAAAAITAFENREPEDMIFLRD